MKPTSLIFLVLSAILIVGGIFTCKYAETLAEKNGTPIYEQYTDEEGNFIYEHEINDISVSSLSLSFSDVDVIIEATDGASGVTLTNFAVNDYAVILSGSSLKVDGTVGFLESLLERSSGGLSFRGFRYFFADKPDASAKKTVTVRISDYSKLNTVSISLKKGNLYLSGIKNPLDYKINITGGSAVIDGVSTVSVVDAYIENGDYTCSDSNIFTTIVSVENGNVKITSDGLFDASSTTYDLAADHGTIIYNGDLVEESPYKSSAAVLRNTIRVSLTNGTINIRDDIKPADDETAEQQGEENPPENN